MKLAFRLHSPPFKRTVTLRCEPGSVTGRVTDNVHDFEVKLEHDGAQVTHVKANAIRVPWTTCPVATDRVQALVGASVLNGRRVVVEQAQQCTHLLDVAKLAIAHVQRGGERYYEISILPTADPRACRARIWRDGSEVLYWHLIGGVVVEPPLFAGHVATGRAFWPPEVHADSDLREAALIVRRSLIVFWGRRRVTPATFRASSLTELAGVCTSFQPDLVGQAVRPPNFIDLDADAVPVRPPNLVSRG